MWASKVFDRTIIRANVTENDTLIIAIMIFVLCVCLSCNNIGTISKLSVHGYISWWRHQMETISALLTICAGNSPVRGEFPTQRPVTRSFDAFFDLRMNKRLSKQWWGWWFDTPSCSLWGQHNLLATYLITILDYMFRCCLIMNCIVKDCSGIVRSTYHVNYINCIPIIL